MRLLRSLGRQLKRRSKNENPSVTDYTDKKSLIHAMKGRRPTIDLVGDDSASMSSNLSDTESGFGDSSHSVGSQTSSMGEGAHVEWTLPLVDTDVTEPQTMEDEVKRLHVLQSYFVLDSEGEAEFDRITRMGSKLFDTPICLISLVDFGRQWFLSRVGLDAEETPRSLAFCAHVILNKYKLMVVPDATQDFRFRDNPLVTGGPKIRFYAGAALVSPEGYKLGTVCVISPHTRPKGLNEAEQELLHELAALAVSAMVARRNRLIRDEYETKFHGLAKTFMDTKGKLDEAQKSIETVLARNSWDIDSEDTVELNATANRVGVQATVCAAAARNIVQDTPLKTNQSVGADHSSGGTDPPNIEEDDGFLDSMLEYDRIVDPTTDISKLFDNLNSLCSSFPHDGEVSLELHKSVPRFIIAEDLLLFRSTLNMVTHCMGASKQHRSGLRMRTSTTDGTELLIQCVQGGPLVSSQAAKQLFLDKDSLLAPVATMVRSLGGRYGMYQGRWERHHNSKTPLQSIYWFRVPFELPEGMSKSSSTDRFKRTQFKVHAPNNSSNAEKENTVPDRPNADPFQRALLMDAGCAGSGSVRRLQVS